jgi:hypothetical protein
MNVGGWIMLVVMWGAITGVGVYCFYRVLSRRDDTSL